MMKAAADVIIIGAGPVGLLAALRLGQAGINTIVLEGHHELLQATRAIVYMPVVIQVLEQLGLGDTVRQAAYLNQDGVSWLDMKGKKLAQLPLGSGSGEDFDGVLQLGQYRLARTVLAELEKYPSVSVLFGHKVADLKDDETSPTVKLVTRSKDDSSETTFEAGYVLATDGANSTTRKLLGINFDGFTYEDFRMIGTDVLYDFTNIEGYGSLNFTVDPDDWAVLVYTGQDDKGQYFDPTAPSSQASDRQPEWRIAYAEPKNLSTDRDEIWKRAEDRVKRYCHSQPNKAKLLRAEPYEIQQRCATIAKKGRVCLAGDALHSNNPIGGLGLTTGILDAFAYGNALIRTLIPSRPQASGPSSETASTNGDTSTHEHLSAQVSTRSSDHILTECAETRLLAWQNTTNMLSQTNLKRISRFDETATREREAFFAQLNNQDSNARSRFVQGMRQGLMNLMPPGKGFEEGVAETIASADRRNKTIMC